MNTTSRRPRRSIASRVAAGVLALAAPAVSILLNPASAAADDPVTVESGSLTWGLRQSWRTYVGVDNITTTGGATVDEAGIVTFPVSGGSFDAETGATNLSLSGGVHYVQHCGHYANGTADDCALDVTISDPELVVDAAQQTLYGHVRNRAAGTDDDVPPIEDLGVLALAELDATGAAPETRDGHTVWHDVPTTLHPDGVPVFGAYQAGTQLDPVSFEYDGPGGLPDFEERWTAPGTIAMGPTASWSNIGAWYGVYGIYPDHEGDVVHVTSGLPPTSAPFARALNAETLAPVGDSGGFGAGITSTAPTTTFDPETSTIFTITMGSHATVQSLAWQPESNTYQAATIDILEPGLSGGTSLVWDAATDRLYTRITDSGIPHLYAWEHNGDAWIRSEYVLPEVEGWRYLTYYNETGPGAFTVVGDGSLLLARRNPQTETIVDGSIEREPTFDSTVLHLTIDGETVSVEEVPGSGTNSGQDAVGTTFTVAVATLGDRIALVKTHDLAYLSVRFGHIGANGIELDDQTTRVDITGTSVTTAFDHDDGMLWVKDYGVGAHFGVGSDGEPRAAFTASSGTITRAIAVGADHTVFTATRDTAGTPGIARYERLAVSPTITAHPADTTVTVPYGADTAEAIFEATATADPAPAIRWQAKAPSDPGFTDIAGAADATLQTTVNTVHDGWQYRAVFTNAAGSIATEPATLTITTAPAPTEPPTSTPGSSVGATTDTIDNTSSSSKLPTTGPSLTLLIAAAAALLTTGTMLTAITRNRHAKP